MWIQAPQGIEARAQRAGAPLPAFMLALPSRTTCRAPRRRRRLSMCCSAHAVGKEQAARAVSAEAERHIELAQNRLAPHKPVGGEDGLELCWRRAPRVHGDSEAGAVAAATGGQRDLERDGLLAFPLGGQVRQQRRAAERPGGVGEALQRGARGGVADDVAAIPG